MGTLNNCPQCGGTHEEEKRRSDGQRGASCLRTRHGTAAALLWVPVEDFGHAACPHRFRTVEVWQIARAPEGDDGPSVKTGIAAFLDGPGGPRPMKALRREDCYTVPEERCWYCHETSAALAEAEEQARQRASDEAAGALRRLGYEVPCPRSPRCLLYHEAVEWGGVGGVFCGEDPKTGVGGKWVRR